MNKIMLFSFRKSHNNFFKKIKKNCTIDIEMNILSTRDKIIPSYHGFTYLKNINFNPAYKFAIDEFYAKTNLKIPRIFLKSFFVLFAHINFFRYFSLMDDKYDKLLLWNGGKFRQLIAIEIAKIKNIKVYYFENGLLPNRIVFDEKGINSNNSVPRNKDFFINYNNALELPNSIIQRTGKREYKFNGDKISLPEKFIFIPFQVDYDTQIISNSTWIKNMRMLFNIIERMSKNINFIFKEHPSSGVNYSDLHKKAESINNIAFANTYSTQELIQLSFAVITINSTVGIESLLFHKKVIVLGDAFYDIDGITFGVSNEQNLYNIILDINNKYLDVKLIDNFLKYLYYEYLVVNDETMYNIFYKKLIS